MGFVIRAGIQILAAYPRLTGMTTASRARSGSVRARRVIHPERPWIAREQEETWSAWVAQPGGNNLGLGRHWHFASVGFWVLNGLIYVIGLFVSGAWPRLVPQTWAVLPDAWHTFVGYLTLQPPPASAFDPFDALQQLAYGGVVFLVAPLLILTGAAQSPAIDARFPRVRRHLRRSPGCAQPALPGSGGIFALHPHSRPVWWC